MDKQDRRQRRKNQRDQAKRLKQSLEDDTLDCLVRESDELPAVSVQSVLSSHCSTIHEPSEDLPHEEDNSECFGAISREGSDDSNQRSSIDNPSWVYRGHVCDLSATAPSLQAEDLSSHSDEDVPEMHPNFSDSSSESEPAQNNPTLKQLNFDLTELHQLLAEIENEEAHPDATLIKKLTGWIVKNNVVHSHVDNLLKILQSEGHPKIPGTCKTLLKTPKNIKDRIKPLGSGAFWYRGLQAGMLPILCEEHVIDGVVTIDVYADGACPYNSVRVSLWPLVARIVGSNPPLMFIIAIWCGSTKEPDDLNGYLKDFVTEAGEMMIGFLWNGRQIKLKIRFYIADAPGRAYLKNVVGHTTYGSCERCSLHGQWKGRITFPPGSTAEPRTDHTFSARVHGAYHKGDSPLEKLGTDMISQFPLDGMHLLYLGVMRKLLGVLLNEKKPSIHKLSQDKQNELSDLLISFAPYCPSEFSRKPRSLQDWKLLKAHELRRILLYDGVLLYSQLPASLYNNFLLFHVAVRILSDKKKIEFFDDADYLLKKFVQNAANRNVYGPTFCVYNVHHLEHFAKECEEHGLTIEEFSAFLNENFIGALKDLLSAPGRTLPQIIARVLEKAQSLQPEPSKPLPMEFHGQHASGPLLDLHGQQFRKLILQGMTLKSDSINDSHCIMEDGAIVNIRNIVKTVNEAWVVGKPYYTKEDMYVYPMKSSILGTFKVSRLLEYRKWRVQDIQQKCMCLPIIMDKTETGSYLCLPMLQHFEL